MNPTDKQREVAERVRLWLRKNRLQVEDDMTTACGVVELHTSGRESAGDSFPSDVLRRKFKAHAEELRSLSDYVYVSLEAMDEWILMRVEIKPTPRMERPTLVDGLPVTVALGLPAVIADNPLLLAPVPDIYPGADGAIRFQIKGRRRDGIFHLRWRLHGTETTGWRVRVDHGVHTADVAVASPVVDAKFILRCLRRILRRRHGVHDALGWRIEILLTDGTRRLSPSGRMSELHPWQVCRDGRLDLRGDKDARVLFTNKISGEELVLKQGAVYPACVKPITIKVE